MAAISLSIKRGVSGSKISDFTPGTLAPGANDVELRFNTTDANSVLLTKKDIHLALKAFEVALEQGGSQVGILTTPVL